MRAAPERCKTDMSLDQFGEAGVIEPVLEWKTANQDLNSSI